MKKVYVLIIALLCTAALVAQEKQIKKVNKDTKLVEVEYYYDNGNLQQKGTFNEQGKLHGKWVSYDINGDKLSVGSYDNGKKVGKWFFWTKESLKEVDYSNSRIVSVSKWDNKTQVAIRNK